MTGLGGFHNRYLFSGILLGLVAVCLIGLFHSEASGALKVWLESRTYNHGFLILPIALYMAWSRRDRLAGLSPAPEPWALVLIGLLSLLWIVAYSLDVLEARQFLVLMMFQAAMLCILGGRIARVMAAPILYLLFLVPSGDYLIPFLQDITAHFAVAALRLVGVPVFSNGTIIEVPSGTFVVAEACAGLRFLVAAVAFCVFMATEFFNSYRRRILFILLSVVVPIIANGLRAFGLIAASEIFGDAAAVEADHILYGWIFFSMVLALLIWIGWKFSDRPFAQAPAAAWDWAAGANANGRGALASMALLCLAVAMLGPTLRWALVARTQTAPMPASAPFAVAGSAAAAEGPQWQPLLKAPDKIFQVRIPVNAVAVDAVAAIYSPVGGADNLIRSDNRIADPEIWHPVSRGVAPVTVGGEKTEAATAIVSTNVYRRRILSFYLVDGRIVAGAGKAKLAQAAALLDGRRCLDAWVAVSADITADEAQADAAMRQILSGVTPLHAYLCGAGR